MKTKEDKIRARKNFNEFAKNFYDRDFGKLNEIQKGRALIHWYLFEIAEGRESPIISEDDIDADIIDGSRDLGADLIIKDNGTVFIYQFKFFKNDDIGPEVRDIEHFRNIIQRLSSDEFKANEKLKNKIIEINFEEDAFVLRFIALGKTSENVQAAIDDAKEKKDDDPINGLSFEYHDIETLTNELRSSRADYKISDIRAKVFVAGDRNKRLPIIEFNENKLRSYLMLVDAGQIKELFGKYGERLFEKNIRNSLKSNTNTAMRDTAKKKPENFYFFNNGISCLATKVERHADFLLASGLQVINGAQTVKTLAEVASRNPPDPLPKVLVRLTEIPEETAESEGLRDDITRFNNTQNKITSSDFRSNDPIQQFLKTEFNKIKRNNLPIAYISKRGEKSTGKKEIIKMEEFTKVIFAFLKEPLNHQLRSEALFDNSSDGNYACVFGDGHRVLPYFNEEEFRLRSAIWWLHIEFTKQSRIDREKSEDTFLKGALQRKWVLIHATRQALEKKYGPENYAQKLAKYWRGDWALGKDSAGDQFKKLYDTVVNFLRIEFKEYVEAQPGGDSRSWLGSSKTFQKISNDFERWKTSLNFEI